MSITSTIPDTQCVGDSLITINSNFAALDSNVSSIINTTIQSINTSILSLSTSKIDSTALGLAVAWVTFDGTSLLTNSALPYPINAKSSFGIDSVTRNRNFAGQTGRYQINFPAGKFSDTNYVVILGTPRYTGGLCVLIPNQAANYKTSTYYRFDNFYVGGSYPDSPEISIVVYGS